MIGRESNRHGWKGYTACVTPYHRFFRLMLPPSTLITQSLTFCVAGGICNRRINLKGGNRPVRKFFAACACLGEYIGRKSVPLQRQVLSSPVDVYVNGFRHAQVQPNLSNFRGNQVCKTILEGAKVLSEELPHRCA